jgi:N-acyl-D-aspartate/D-glutamate deacylase
MHDLVIRGATVVDGLGHDPLRADVAVKDGRLAAISEVGTTAAAVVDAGGLTLMPGIIDKGPGRVLDRYLPAIASPMAAAAK